jgi:hypothetical protein
MRKLIAFAALVSLFPTCALAAANVNKPRMPGVIKTLPLTEGQCTQLGGETLRATICNSGRMCQTIDQNKVVHRVCINE